MLNICGETPLASVKVRHIRIHPLEETNCVIIVRRDFPESKLMMTENKACECDDCDNRPLRSCALVKGDKPSKYNHSNKRFASSNEMVVTKRIHKWREAS